MFTRGGKTYYYNSKTSETVWSLPEELNTKPPEEGLLLMIVLCVDYQMRLPVN